MAIRVVPYEQHHQPAVVAFNIRMGDGGSDWRFYEQCEPDWLRPGEAATVERQYLVATDDEGAVHGAYCLKPQTFLLRGEAVTIANWQGPVSEGLVNPRYALLAMAMFKDMAAREANLFAWGASERMLELLKRMRWQRTPTPLMLRVERPARFLRLNRFLRHGRLAKVLDVLAVTGLGALGNGAVKAVHRVWRGRRMGNADVTIEARFGAWSDRIWESAAPHFHLLAVRDARSMNALLPEVGWPEAQILRVSRAGHDLGWAAVRLTPMQGDVRFGDCVTGSIIDCLAVSGEEQSVAKAAAGHLRAKGADLIVGNFSAACWIRALQGCGFVAIPDRRDIIVSDAMAARLTTAEVDPALIHLTSLDGDGPRGL